MRWEIFAAALAISAALARPASANPPAEAFGALPMVSEPAISPDGKYFAAIQPVNGRPAAIIYQINAPAGSKPSVYASSDWIVAGISWLKPDKLMVITKSSRTIAGDRTLRSFYRGAVIDMNGGDPITLFSNDPSINFNTSGVTVADKDLDDPDHAFMPLWTEVNGGYAHDDPAVLTSGYGQFLFSLNRIDMHTGKSYLQMKGSSLPGDWIMDGHGNIVARVDRSESPLIDHVKIYQTGGTWREIAAVDASADNGAGILGLTPDGRALTHAARGARDYLDTIDLAAGRKGPAIFSNDQYDFQDALYDEWNGRVIGANYAADKDEYVYFDPSREAVQRGLEAAFPGTSVHAVSTTLDGTREIVLVSAPRKPPSYYFLDRTTHQASKIAAGYPGLTESDLGDVTPYPYKARDGMSIPAYLTIPPGREARNLPLVVFPHGGPDARDTMDFDWWAQFMTNRGYAVFQPNYRGSSGYGHAFTEAGLKQWGLKMQDDITDGVNKLIADGVVDPKRICIVGASYGGYAALAGATFTPDLYRCAVSFAGVSDLDRMLVDERAAYGGKSSAVSFWASRIGDRDTDETRIAATSPALHADQVKIPILLMHGKGDTTVPLVQGEKERDALKTAGKDVTFVTFDTDDHYLSLGETRIAMLKQLESFLDKNIGH